MENRVIFQNAGKIFIAAAYKESRPYIMPSI